MSFFITIERANPNLRLNPDPSPASIAINGLRLNNNPLFSLDSTDIEDAFDIFWNTQINNAENLNFHLIYAYLIENTRIFQIFERVIETVARGETLGILSNESMQWIRTTEHLFFKQPHFQSRTMSSSIRPNSEENRRNAYFRLFGMDLTHGDPKTPEAPYIYHRAEIANRQFQEILEKLMTEIWQGQINLRNTSGSNTTDIDNITDLIRQLRNMLLMRRTRDVSTFITDYRNTTLAREEYCSILMATWLYVGILTNTPICNDLQSSAVTPAERILKIGKKVGLPALSKSEDMFELARLMSIFLRSIELGIFNPINIPVMLDITQPLGQDMRTIINLWQRTTKTNLKLVK